MRARLIPLLIVMLGLAAIFVSCARKYHLDRNDLAQGENWACSRGSAAQLGVSASREFDGRLNLLWKNDFGGKPVGPLAIHNNALIMPDTKKKIRFYDLRDGHYLGRLKAKGVPQSGIAVADSIALYAVSPKKNFVRAYNLFSGKRLWQSRVKDANSGPIILDNRLFVSSRAGQLLAYEIDNGELSWTARFDGLLTASVSYADGRLYQPGDDGLLHVVSADDGHKLYDVQLDGSIVTSVAVSDHVYVTDILGNVYALDPSDGAIVWQTKLDGPVWTSPAVADGRVFVGHSGGEVVALKAESGETIWRYSTGAVVRASVLVTGDLVVAGTMAGNLMVLRADDGSLVDSTTLKGAIEFPPVTDGRRLFVATQAGKIVCFGEDDEQADHATHGVNSQPAAQ